MKLIHKVEEKMKKGETFFSFEFFPPRTEEGVENLFERLDRMVAYGPVFCDITWGAGGSTADVTLDIATRMQNLICVETMMHLTCTNMPEEKLESALHEVKKMGVQNILALRGDPPKGQDKFEAVEGGFNCALDLVKYIRKQHGDYFGICVAGYPEAHPDGIVDDAEQMKKNYWADIAYLKQKVDAGGDMIVTQLFYDVDVFLQFVKDCRSVGITCPILPGIMPIMTYGGFKRMTGFCKTKVPAEISDALEAIKDNDEAVKAYGIDLGVRMCRQLLASGEVPGVHMYTLNLEKSAVAILEQLGLVDTSRVQRPLPWRHVPAGTARAVEQVRPVFWSNRPKAYVKRTQDWDSYPAGRWGNTRSPAYGALSDHQFMRRHSTGEARREKARAAWGAAPASVDDVKQVFVKYIKGEVSLLPWAELDGGLTAEAAAIREPLAALNATWELTRHPTPHCKGFRELLQRIDLAARLLVIATVAATGSPAAAAGAAEAVAGGEAAAAAALVSAMAALESGEGKAAASPSSTTSGSGPDDLFEERLALAAQATSLVANLAGLGTRGFELSAAGLAPQRAWLLRPGTLGLLRPVLEGLADGLAELRHRMEDSSSAGEGAEKEQQEKEQERLQALGPYADLRPSTVSRRRLLDQAEGAVRNLLILLGLPTVVMGTSEEDVVEACGFVIRHAFGMFTEGYIDTMRVLRSAVADPAASASGRAFTSPYPGDYANFFRAFAGHVETVAPALGVQLEDWGVRFTGEQAARDLPGMQVAEGVDARIAQSWLKGQIQEIINWGHSVLNLVRMAEQAKMSPQQRQQAQQQQQQQAQAQAQQQSFPPVAPPHPYGGPGAGTGAAASGGSNCASCGTAPPAGNPPFQHCGKCRTVRYCSRACQLAHWPHHKPVCKPAPTAAQSAAAPTQATATS